MDTPYKMYYQGYRMDEKLPDVGVEVLVQHNCGRSEISELDAYGRFGTWDGLCHQDFKPAAYRRWWYLPSNRSKT